MTRLAFNYGFYNYRCMINIDGLINYLNELKKDESILKYNSEEERNPLYDNFDTIYIKFSNSDDYRGVYFTTESENFLKYESLDDYTIGEIISPIISNFFNDEIFFKKFYKKYLKNYFEKMNSTIKNYVVSSIEYETVIPPIETGWLKYIKTEQAAETIDDLALSVAYALKKQKVIIYNDSKYYKTVKCTLYDLLMRPTHITNVLHNTFEVPVQETSPMYRVQDIGALYRGYNYKDLIHLDRYSNYLFYSDVIAVDKLELRDHLTPINYLKSIVRYVFVSQFKDAIPYYLYNQKYTNSCINSIIADIELFYTKNLSILRKNMIYYRDLKDECSHVITENDGDITRVISRDICTALTNPNFVAAISKNNKAKFNEFISMQDKDTREFPYEAFVILKTMLDPLYINTENALKNSYNFSFVKRWNELMEDNSIWNAKDYIKSIRGFLN